MKPLSILFLSLPMIAWSDESSVKLKDAPGRELIIANCAICHSLDYIPMNSPFLDAAGWEKEVQKMVRFGAPVSESEAPALVHYLNAAYGR